MKVPDECPFTKGGEPRAFHSLPKRRKDCQRCGGPLPPRAFRWCSSTCEQIWHSNHTWGPARKAALERDKRCVRCGSDGSVPPAERERLKREYDAWMRANPAPTREEHGSKYYEAHWAWRKRANAECPSMDKLYLRFQLEVNHIVPVLRKTSTTPTSCANHLDNLETLCHPCHLVETKAQAAARRNKAQPLPLFEAS